MSVLDIETLGFGVSKETFDPPSFPVKTQVTIQILFWSTRFSVSNSLKFSGGHKIVVRLSCCYQFENSVN